MEKHGVCFYIFLVGAKVSHGDMSLKKNIGRIDPVTSPKPWAIKSDDKNNDLPSSGWWLSHPSGLVVIIPIIVVIYDMMGYMIKIIILYVFMYTFMMVWYIHKLYWLVVAANPSEKWWSSSVGMMKLPIYEKKNVPNHQPETIVYFPYARLNTQMVILVDSPLVD